MRILDTTLRDGSYVNNFQFDLATTAAWCSRLDKCGIDYIEVGHGIGLKASESGYGKALQTDIEYMVAAKTSIKNSKWGIFAIPGICQLKDFKSFDDIKPDFVRLGVGFNNIEVLPAYIEVLKAKDIECCVNFMKSHTQSPLAFSKAAREVYKMGADLIYLVDSAGNMTPRMIENYMERLIGIPVGFHGHNNMGLANANALIAYQSGASMIDASMTGLGRSAGNTVTEQIVPLMQSLGSLCHIDMFELLDFSDEISSQLVGGGYFPSVDVVCGFAGFHTSYMEIIRAVSKEYNVDLRKLIIEVCKEDQIDLDINRARKCAQELDAQKVPSIVRKRSSTYYGNEQKEV